MEFLYLYIGILNDYDLISSKLVRGTSVDFEDCLWLAEIRRSEIDIERLIHHFHEMVSYDVAENRLKPNIDQFLELLHKKGLSKEDKALVKTWKNYLARNQTLKCNDTEFDPERLKGLFELYFEKKTEKDRRRKEKFEEFSLEYALSQVFPPKQKELFRKKLEGLPLTKTEQEYYSRTVKKKVVALANSELHGLSKGLLEI